MTKDELIALMTELQREQEDARQSKLAEAVLSSRLTWDVMRAHCRDRLDRDLLELEDQKNEVLKLLETVQALSLPDFVHRVPNQTFTGDYQYCFFSGEVIEDAEEFFYYAEWPSHTFRIGENTFRALVALGVEERGQ